MTDEEIARRMADLLEQGWDLPPVGIAAEYGPLKYGQVQADPARWACIRDRLGCQVSSRHDGPFVFDHCHKHGFVRAVVCRSCNVRLGQLDAARALPGVIITATSGAFGRIIDACLPCRDASVMRGM